MKKFMLIHFGFEKPSPEDMQAWGEWFQSIADREVDKGGFAQGRELTAAGIQELPWGPNSLTGYNVIEAESLDEATEIAKGCPIVASLRVYELR